MGVAWIRELRAATKSGAAPCGECPAYEADRAQRPLPGFGNPDGALLVVTPDPLEPLSWDELADWRAYNTAHHPPTNTDARIGMELEVLLELIDGVTPGDVWVSSTIKCPPAQAADHAEREAEFDCCRSHLAAELDAVAPDVVLGVGAAACHRVLAVLGVVRSHVPVVEECGRVFETKPPLVVAPHWQYGWLTRPLPDTWGAGWQETQPELHPRYDCCRHAVQDALTARLP